MIKNIINIELSAYNKSNDIINGITDCFEEISYNNYVIDYVDVSYMLSSVFMDSISISVTHNDLYGNLLGCFRGVSIFRNADLDVHDLTDCHCVIYYQRGYDNIINQQYIYINRDIQKEREKTINKILND